MMTYEVIAVCEKSSMPKHRQTRGSRATASAARVEQWPMLSQPLLVQRIAQTSGPGQAVSILLRAARRLRQQACNDKTCTRSSRDLRYPRGREMHDRVR